jgi:glycosyltransferase involved in cell wall biosynthesis
MVVAPVYFTVLSIAKMRHKKIVLTVHNATPHEKSWLKNKLNDSILNLADSYIVHAENVKKTLEKKVGAKPISVIPHGIIQKKESSTSKKELKKEYKIQPNEKVILFFGNIREYKGLDDLLLACSKITQYSYKLIIVGQPWGPFEKYSKSITALNLNKNILLFLGYQSDKKVAEMFKLADVVVYPYKEFDSSSGAAALGLNYSKSMVVTDVGGLPELVADTKTIAKTKNPLDLKSKIEYALKNQKKLEKSSREIAKKFTWSKISEKTLEVYNST